MNRPPICSRRHQSLVGNTQLNACGRHRDEVSSAVAAALVGLVLAAV